MSAHLGVKRVSASNQGKENPRDILSEIQYTYMDIRCPYILIRWAVVSVVDTLT